MMTQLRLFLLAVLVCVLGSCEEEPPLPDNIIGFETSEVGFEGDETDIKLILSRAESEDIGVVISLEATGVEYGTQFTTEPVAIDGTLTVTIPAGSTDATFKVVKSADVFLEGTESIDFTIDSAGEPLVLGVATSLNLSFSAITSEGSTLQLNGIKGAESGSSAGNSVFVDLSSNKQTPVARSGWDLGFYNGSDFRVIINNVNGASVVAVNKTDLNTVTAADIDPDDLAVGFGEGDFTIVDDVEGDITKTAIPVISSTDADNKVYVINRAGGAGSVGPTEDLIKVRVLRATDGYTLQYAKINATSFSTLTVTKDLAHHFQYVSFDEGTIAVAPEKAKWDFMWSWTMYKTELGPPGSDLVPFGFSDFVTINHLNEVQAVEVMTSSVTFGAFAASNLSSITFSSDRNVIGSNWRTASPTPGASGVKTDRFYVIKDSAGNIYKLKFVSFHADDGGARGKPVIEYELVQEAD